MSFNGLFLYNIIDQASSRGASKVNLLSMSGQSETDLINNSCKINFGTFNKTFEIALKQVSDPLFGIHITESMSYKAASLMLKIAQQSKTYKEALILACNHTMMGCETMPMRLEETDYAYELIFDFDRTWRSNSEETFQHILEGAMYFLLKEYAVLTNKRLTPKKITLDYTPRVSFKELERYYRTPVFIRTNRNTVVFRKKDLDQKIEIEDYDLLLHLVSFAENQINLLPKCNTIVEKVARIVMKRLPERATALAVAQELNMSVRTMQRQLKYDDTSFRAILEKYMMEFAKNEILKSNHSLSEIAKQLSYSDLSAFSRAYRKHFGVSPSKSIEYN